MRNRQNRHNPQNWEYTLHIPHDRRAVGIGRRALRDILTTHRRPDLLEPAELLVSELLGNAIRHTNGPALLKMKQVGPTFRLGAWDSDPKPPTLTPHTDTTESGHGLHLINAYADDWGWFPVNGAYGKYVWCVLGTKSSQPR